MNVDEKAWDILSKINGCYINTVMWGSASDYARHELKRKSYIVVDEIMTELESIEINYGLDVVEKSIKNWKKIREYISNL